MSLFRFLPAMLLATTFSYAAFPTLYLKNVCDDQLHAPTNITNAGDGSGRLFICDQMGKIYIFKDGMLQPTPFLNISSATTAAPNDGPGPVVAVGTTYTERGLLGMCFHPDYENVGTPGYRCFYVNYTAFGTHPTLNPVTYSGTTNCVSVIAEYKASLTNPDIADPASARIVLTYGQPQSNHNGGQIEFGPDGYLYVGIGDGGGQNDNQFGHAGATTAGTPGRVSGNLGNGQDRRTLLGKILRIDPLGTNGPGGTYGIPASNPFVGQTQDFTDDTLDGPMRGEIYAYGLRNPWRFCFDSNFGGTARMICADVGQIDIEEIDFITNGGNYGWRMKEGTADFDSISAYGGSPPSTIAPVAQYTHPAPTLIPATPIVGTSITGGYVYRGSAIPALQGKYLFADYAVNGIGSGAGILLGMEESSPGAYALSNITVANPLPAAARIYAFGVDEAGEIYVAVKTTSGVLTLDGGKPAGTIYKVQAPSSGIVNLTANRDNTIFSDFTTSSNGKGAHIFAGKIDESTGGGHYFRRALLRFDLTSIPSNASIQSAELILSTTRQLNQDIPFTVHRVTSDWGEGNSNAGEPGGKGIAAQTNDATWFRRFFNTISWTTPGGDFISTASASATVGNFLSAPTTTWSGAGISADIQAWLTNPANNFGWILIGNESTTDPNANASAQRFASREYSVVASRPKLTISYTASPQPSPYETWFAAHFPTAPPGTFLDPKGDNDGDGIFNQIEYAYGFSPVSYNTPGSDQFSTELVPSFDDSTDYTISFRRDSSATDLTYNLQTSEDLLSWTTIATSASGALTTGDNGGNVMSDMVVSGTIRLVTVSENLAAGSNEKRFVRLEVLRATP